MKIQKPWKGDCVGNAASIYSRKGYFGINVQVIVDKQKKILSRSIKLRGAEHNSTAFKSTALYKWLLINWRQLASKGLHFIGDSAYSIKLLMPMQPMILQTITITFSIHHRGLRLSVALVRLISGLVFSGGHRNSP